MGVKSDIACVHIGIPAASVCTGSGKEARTKFGFLTEIASERRNTVGSIYLRTANSTLFRMRYMGYVYSYGNYLTYNLCSRRSTMIVVGIITVYI